jgi:hypothetical protein
MRRVVIAPSFDREAEAIGAGIEERFGEKTRLDFVADLALICALIARLPNMGKAAHGYDTKLVGFPFGQNWLFFDFDDKNVHFLHIVSAKRLKKTISF